MTDDDRARLSQLKPWEVAGLTAYLESRSEPVQGIVAVLHVIRTRGLRREKSWADVCFQPYQFSCWNTSDPNYSLGLWLAGRLLGKRDLPTRHDIIVFETCLWLAERIFHGDVSDPTNGATHYHTTALIPRPNWANPPAQVSATIGRHRFYKHVP